MRSPVSFFQSLAKAAGRSIPAQTVGGVVRPIETCLESTDAKDGQIVHDIVELTRRLGLTVTQVRSRIDEAVALAVPFRPVLVGVRGREGGIVLLGVHFDDGSWVRVEMLDGDDHRSVRVPVHEVTSSLDLEGAEILIVARIGAMGGHVEEAAHAASATAPGSTLTRLWSFVKPDRSELWIVFGFSLVVGVLALATPVAVQSLVTYVAFGGLIQPLIVLGVLMLFFLAFSGAIQAFKVYVVEILQRRVFVRVVSDLSVRLPRVKIEAYDKRYGPELVNRFFDVVNVQKAGSSLLLDGLDVVLQTAVGLAVLGFYHPFLLVFDAILIVSIYLLLQVVGRGAIRTAIAESKAKYQVAGKLEELARVPVTYKLAGAPELARAKLAELASQYIGRRETHFSIVFRQVMGTIGLYVLASTALLTLGGWLVIRNQLTLGQLIAAELIVSVAMASFVKFATKLDSYYHLLAGVDKLGVLYDLPVEQDLGESHRPRTVAASVQLRDVSYSFAGAKRPVVDSCSFRVEPGERVAVLGDRGSGKTAMADLIAGLRDAQRGIVFFDDLDIHDVANESLRLQVELVRGVEMIEGTVLENVRLGRSDIAPEGVRDVLERLGILDELVDDHEGLRTPLSPSGSPLSSSTSRLLMVARAVSQAPRLIVVDSLLDDLLPIDRSRALRVLAGPNAPWTLVVLTSSGDVAASLDRSVRMLDWSSAGPSAVSDRQVS